MTEFITTISAQDLFKLDALPPEAVLESAALECAFWQIKKMQRESRQQQMFWKSVNDSMSDAYTKLAALQEEIKSSREDLQQVNARLEEQVRARTEALTRIANQEEMIRALFTPIIRVWEQVLVLPIIGDLDPRRGGEIMHNLLHAVVDSQCTFVVLDLTGVKTVDGETADHLIQINRAVRLLGAECLLSGISSSLAQAILAQRLDLRDLVSFSTLYAALRHALMHMGELPRGSKGRLARG